MANYTKGTVSITDGSNVVTGFGTAWAYKNLVGRYLTVNGLNRPYQVALVVDDATIVLTRPIALFGGVSASILTLIRQSYSINDSFTPNLSVPIINKDDIDKQPRYVRGLRAIDQQKTLVTGYQRRKRTLPITIGLDLGVPGNFALFGDVPVPLTGVFSPMSLDLSQADFIPFF